MDAAMFATLHQVCRSSPDVLNFPLHLQSRIVRGLLQPLLIVTALSSVVAIYETLLEVKLLICDNLPGNHLDMPWSPHVDSAQHVCMHHVVNCFSFYTAESATSDHDACPQISSHLIPTQVWLHDPT